MYNYVGHRLYTLAERGLAQGGTSQILLFTWCR